MVIPHIILFSLLFSVGYPLFFWMRHTKASAINNLYKFHIAVPNVIGGMTTVCVLFLDIPLMIKLMIVLWKAIFIAISYSFWKEGVFKVWVMGVLTFLGFYVFYQLRLALLTGN